MRAWGRALAVLVTAVTVTGGTTTATAEESDRLTGDDAAHAEAGDIAAASTIVPMPDLGITHQLPGGGMNLWRIPLSDVEAGYGVPALAKTLNYGGFSYANSVTLPGDFADFTASDDGTADHVIWHAQPNGGVLVWAAGGGGDTTPRLLHDLRTGGWSYALSRPLVGDVTGDGWDDLVVRHRYNGSLDNIWVFPSNGTQLGAPQFYKRVSYYASSRDLIADLDGDGVGELVTARHVDVHEGTLGYEAVFMDPNMLGGGRELFLGPRFAGWSYSASRTVAGDVTGDGLVDLVTIHAQPNGGILAWMHENCYTGSAYFCMEAPVLWQDLRTGGWSYAGSRQHLADTDADSIDDLVSVHSQGGNPGMLIWRHRSNGSSFTTPQIVTDLKTGGWSYLSSREAVARTFGVLVT